jgi:hypothetical protein
LFRLPSSQTRHLLAQPESTASIGKLAKAGRTLGRLSTHVSNQMVIAILQRAGDPNSVTGENTVVTSFWILYADVTIVHGFIDESAVSMSYTHMSLPPGTSVGLQNIEENTLRISRTKTHFYIDDKVFQLKGLIEKTWLINHS